MGKKLLKTTDEESLECLCRLLTTVGQVLDQETKQRLSKGPQNGLNDLSVYFTEMKKITQDKKVCSRVRFLMQDVIELRVADWKLRREIAGPKTIEQIHADVAKEELNAKLNQMSSGPPGPMPGRRDERSGRNDDRRSSRKGPERGEKGAPGAGHAGGEDGWQAVPSRPARGTFEKVDTSRIKSLTTGKVDADSMSFGPPKAGAGGPSWGRGSQTKGPSRTEDSTKMQNRFAQLESSESSAPQGYDGRGSGGRFGRGGGYTGRNSRGGSSEQERSADRRGAGRAEAAQSVRDFMGPQSTRSQSVMVPHPALLNEMGKQGKSTVASAWRDSGLSWAEFLPSATEVDQFVADNSVEWTLTS